MSQNTVTLCWYPPAKTYLPSPAMTVLKKSLQERLYESQWNPLAFVGFRSMRIYKIKNYISGYLILTALFFAVSNCHAQSFMEKGQKHLPFSEEDATRFVHPALNTATPIMLQE